MCQARREAVNYANPVCCSSTF